MKRSPLIPALLVVFLVYPLPLILADPGNCMFNVPDWNQPADGYKDANGFFIPYTDGYGNRINSYPDWCGPTAGANIMGYWEKNPVLYNGNQVGLRAGIADGKNFYTDNPNSPPFPTATPGTPGTWQQGLWHDATIEMGWFMDTQAWRTTLPPSFPPGIPPIGQGGTDPEKVGSALASYAASYWTDNEYPPGSPSPGTGIGKKGYPNTITFSDYYGSSPNMWANYKAEIDAGRPVELAFTHWLNLSAQGANMYIDPVDPFHQHPVETYNWDKTSDGHMVVGVGYIENASGNWFVCQDNWWNTGQLVAVQASDITDPIDPHRWQASIYLWGLTGRPTYTWSGSDALSPTKWNKPTNWQVNVAAPAGSVITVPSSPGAIIVFPSLGANYDVDMIDDHCTAGEITFQPSLFQTTIKSTGGKTLTLDNLNPTQPPDGTWTAAPAAITVYGQHNILANIALNCDAYITTNSPSDMLLIAGNIADGAKGAKGINKSGSGLLVLGGNNTYSGATHINAGTVLIQGAGNTNAIPDVSAVVIATNAMLNLANNNETIGTLSGGGDIQYIGTLTINDQADATYSGAISGNGGVLKIGPKKLILTGNSSFLGSTTLSGGILQLGNNGTSGSVLGPIVLNNATLFFDRSDDYVYAGGIQNTGTSNLVKHIGNGKLTIQGNANFIGSTIFGSGGGLVIEDTHYQSTITIDNSVKSSNTLELNYNSNAWFIRGAISGNGVLAKTGTGQAILTANNSGYTGPVNILAGQIQIRNSLALGNTTNLVTVSAGGILSSDTEGAINSYSIANNVTLDGTSGDLGGAYLSVQNADTSYTGTIAVVGDGVQIGHISQYQVNGKLFIDGNLIGTNSLIFNSDSSADPMSYTGAVQLRGASTKSFSGPISIVRERLELNVTGANAFNSTDITIGSDTGSSRGVLMLIQPNQIPDAANITFKNTSNSYGFFRLNGNNETVSSVSDLTGRAFIENTENSIAYPVNPAALALAGNSDYTFAGRIRDNTIGDPTAPPALTLTKNGTGTLTLTGSATNFGGIQVNAGKLQIGDSASGGVLSSPVTLNNATSLVFNNHSDAIANCSISGANGSIVQRGDGNTRISGHNSYGGGAFIENGKLIAAQPASLQGDVTFNGNGILSIGSDANAATSVTGFGGNGTGWTFNRRDTGSAPASSVTNDVLTITTADNQEGRSVIYNKRVSLMGFSASFRYTPSTSTTAGPADGITFVLENDLRGAGAVGDAGGNLGYRSGSQPILPSFAAELSIYKKGFFVDFNGGGGFYLDLPGWNYSPTNPVPLDITISYDQNQTFSYLIYDGANLLGGCFMGNFGLLRSALGDTAYIGFTGGTGDWNVKQTIENFSYTTLASAGSTNYTNNLIVAPGVTGSVKVSNRNITLGNLSLGNGAGLNVSGESDLSVSLAGYTLTLGAASVAGSGNIAVAKYSGRMGNLIVSGAISGTGGTLTKTDSGHLSIRGGINPGALSLIDVEDGPLDLTTTAVNDPNLDFQTALNSTLSFTNLSYVVGDISGTGTTNVSSSQLTANSIAQNTLTIGPGATVTITAIPGGPLADPLPITPVPEPSAWAMLMLAAIGLKICRRR